MGTLLAAAAVGCAGELSLGFDMTPDGGQDAAAGESIVITTCDRATEILAGCVACHGTAAAAVTGGGFDMEKADWHTQLLGVSTPADAPDTSVCRGRNLPFLEENVLPARGLFLDKLRLPSPACGAQMPKGLPKLNAADLSCVQAWANGLVAAGTRP